MKVDVYWNVHLGCYSIRHKGVVIGHAHKLLIEKPRYVVNQAGRARVLATKRKEVHAFVRGDLRWWKGRVTERGATIGAAPAWKAEAVKLDRKAYSYGKPVSYNPYKAGTFLYRPQYEPPIAEPAHSGPMILMRIGINRGHKGKPLMVEFEPELSEYV